MIRMPCNSKEHATRKKLVARCMFHLHPRSIYNIRCWLRRRTEYCHPPHFLCLKWVRPEFYAELRGRPPGVVLRIHSAFRDACSTAYRNADYAHVHNREFNIAGSAVESKSVAMGNARIFCSPGSAIGGGYDSVTTYSQLPSNFRDVPGGCCFCCSAGRL